MEERKDMEKGKILKQQTNKQPPPTQTNKNPSKRLGKMEIKTLDWKFCKTSEGKLLLRKS